MALSTNERRGNRDQKSYAYATFFEIYFETELLQSTGLSL